MEKQDNCTQLPNDYLTTFSNESCSWLRNIIFGGWISSIIICTLLSLISLIWLPRRMKKLRISNPSVLMTCFWGISGILGMICDSIAIHNPSRVIGDDVVRSLLFSFFGIFIAFGYLQYYEMFLLVIQGFNHRPSYCGQILLEHRVKIRIFSYLLALSPFVFLAISFLIFSLSSSVKIVIHVSLTFSVLVYVTTITIFPMIVVRRELLASSSRTGCLDEEAVMSAISHAAWKLKVQILIFKFHFILVIICIIVYSAESMAGKQIPSFLVAYGIGFYSFTAILCMWSAQNTYIIDGKAGVALHRVLARRISTSLSRMGSKTNASFISNLKRDGACNLQETSSTTNIPDPYLLKYNPQNGDANKKTATGASSTGKNFNSQKVLVTNSSPIKTKTEGFNIAII